MSRPNGARLGSEAPCRPLPPDAHLKAASPALAWAQQKADDGSRRAGWRSFGEYIFLEDSRYASQRENRRVPGAAQHLKGVYARPWPAKTGVYALKAGYGDALQTPISGLPEIGA